MTTITAESLVGRLRDALKTTGDFPVSARIVSEVSALSKNPNVTAEKISSVILKDPTLGMRLLSVVNSSYYQRGRPILTVSQAIVHIGLNQLADICANLILLQSFVPTARQGGVFANSLRRAILTSVLTELISIQLAAKESAYGTPRSETGYLLGFFTELGAMLLAFYYPQIYQTALNRSKSRTIDINKSIHQLIGITPILISSGIIRALELPPFYAEALLLVNEQRHDPTTISRLHGELKNAVTSIFISDSIAGLIITERRKRDLDRAIIETCETADVSPSVLSPVLSQLPVAFDEYCKMLDLNFAPLPNHLDSFNHSSLDNLDSLSSGEAETISDLIDELNSLVEAGESVTSIMTAAMEALAWGFGFDRVILMIHDTSSSQLNGHMSLGDLAGIDVQAMRKTVPATFNDKERYDVDILAAKTLMPVFQGDPLLPEGWPIVAIPIGTQDKLIGVIYADKFNSTETELSIQQQAGITMLASILIQAATIQDRSRK
jgi:HD-like signal output (HDOD) protein